MILAVLDEVWPQWLTAPEIAAIAGEVDPRIRRGWDRRRPHGRDSSVGTRMVLMRLHDQRVVDRIGVRVHHAPQVRLENVPPTGHRPRSKWQRGAGYRYRIRDEWRGLR